MFGKSLNSTHSSARGRALRLRLTVAASLALLGLVSARAQDFSKSFRVLPSASAVEVVNKMGSVTIVPGDAGAVFVTAVRNGANITAVQLPDGKVRLEVTSDTPVDFKLTVPAASALNVLCVMCDNGIVVKGIRGEILLRTTKGSIQITGARSPRVEASSTSGDVRFDGEILPSGSYTLKSFSGRVAAFLPAGASFRLNATSFRGGMDLQDFPMNFERQSDKFVRALVGSDKATVNLWTQEGGILLRRKN
jgi:hypothetical protein